MIAALSGPYDNCSCPSGYTLDASGQSPSCVPNDASLAPEAPTCVSGPVAPSGDPANAGVSGPLMLFMGVAALSLIALTYEM